MAQIIAYLTFNGNCREAMAFYQECLGGELIVQSLGESPQSEQFPEDMKKYILQSTLTNEKIVLMGTDMVSENGLVKGNSVSLLLDCHDEEEIRSLYNKLSQGGETTFPLKDTFWGSLFGGLTDKFGQVWLLSYSGD